MELELKRGGRTARVETLGGELVSYRDERGLEYIWGGDPAYWPGRNPLLFPIVGMLKEGKIRFDGREYAMERHGFARRREFTPAARGEDWVRLELRESAETLALYPYSFRLAVEQRLTDTGFSTAVTVADSSFSSFRCSRRPSRLRSRSFSRLSASAWRTCSSISAIWIFSCSFSSTSWSYWKA